MMGSAPGRPNVVKVSASSGSRLWKATAMCRSRLTGSSSSGPRSTQANGRRSASSQSSSVVVLPYPAGAVITMVSSAGTSTSRFTRSSRWTRPERRFGARQLATEIPVAHSTASEADPASRATRFTDRQDIRTLTAGRPSRIVWWGDHCFATDPSRPVRSGWRRRNRCGGRRCVPHGARRSKRRPA